MADLVFGCYGHTRNPQVTPMCLGGLLMGRSFPRLQTWKPWHSLLFEPMKRCNKWMKSWPTPDHSKTLFKSTWKDRARHTSKRFRDTSITGGLFRQTPNFVNEFEWNTSQIMYGFLYIQDVFLRGVLMRTVPSSKGRNIFFLHL